MIDPSLWPAYTAALQAYEEDPCAETEARVIDTYSAFVMDFLDDPVAAHESIETLRRNIERARAA